MISPRKTTYAGLNTFNPQAVTPNIRNDNALGSVSDQLVVGQSGVLDTRVSVKQFDATIYPSQGRGPMVLAPDVNTGSYFNDQDRTSRRTEWLTTYGFTPIGPAHLVKVGAGVTYEAFDGTSTSRPVDIVRANGTLRQEIAFVGSGRLSRGKWGIQGYAQDSWPVSPRLSVQYGARFDADSFTGDVNVAPRGSFTAAVTGDRRTIVRGGAGMFYDPIPPNAASLDPLQERSVHAVVGDRQSQRLQHVLGEHRESRDPVRCTRPIAVGCAEPVLVLEQRQPAARLHRVPAVRPAHRISAVDDRRGAELRRGSQRGRALSRLHVARHAGQQAPAAVRP